MSKLPVLLIFYFLNLFNHLFLSFKLDMKILGITLTSYKKMIGLIQILEYLKLKIFYFKITNI